MDLRTPLAVMFGAVGLGLAGCPREPSTETVVVTAEVADRGEDADTAWLGSEVVGLSSDPFARYRLALNAWKEGAPADPEERQALVAALGELLTCEQEGAGTRSLAGRAQARIDPEAALRLLIEEAARGNAWSDAMIEVGPIAIPYVCERLAADEDPFTRWVMLTCMVEATPEASQAVAALPTLLAGLEDPDSRVTHLAARALAAFGPGLVDQLRQSLTADDPQQRRRAARALGMVGPAARSATGDLEARLQDLDPAVAEAAQRTLEALQGGE